MGLIYKITNIVNQKSYIGKTARALTVRWKQHLYDAKNPNKKITALGRAINKYGESSFSLEVLVENLSNDSLDAAESYWIKHYNTFKGIGYNCTKGGDGTCGLIPWNKGKTNVFSAETIERMRKAKIGTTPKNLEQLRKLATERIGIKHQNAKKANIYDYYTNKLIAENVAITTWCKENNYNQGNLCSTARKERPHTKGVYAVYV